MSSKLKRGNKVLIEKRGDVFEAVQIVYVDTVVRCQTFKTLQGAIKWGRKWLIR